MDTRTTDGGMTMKFAKMFWIAALLIFPLISIAQRMPADERAKYINYKYKGVNPESILPNGVNYISLPVLHGSNMQSNLFLHLFLISQL